MSATTTCSLSRVVAAAPHGPEGERHGLWRITIENPGWQARPGQFAMLRPASFGFELVWARPFSLCRVTPEALTFFIQVVGRGTRRIAQLTPGQEVTVWGPLGQGFAVEPDAPTLMLAGGIGIAPFVEYAATHPNPDRLRLLFGHRLPLSCYPFGEMAQSIRATAHLDNGPADLARFLADVEQAMASVARPDAGAPAGLVLACGPTPFLKAVQALAQKTGARTQLSLENRMACGVGACLGCVAKDQGGHHVQTCTKGPVFWADEITL